MLSDLRFTKLGIIRKSQNWMETASLTEAEKKLESKSTQKQISKFCSPVQFYSISVLYFKQFIRDYGYMLQNMCDRNNSRCVGQQSLLLLAIVKGSH